MPTPERGPLTDGQKLVRCKLPDRFEHPVSGFIPNLLPTDQALADQRLEAVKRIEVWLSLRTAELLHCHQSAAGNKYRELAEQPLLRLAEEIVTPGNRTSERLLSRGQVPGAAGQ